MGMREAVIFNIAADATSAERTITAFDRTTKARLRAMTGAQSQAQREYHAVATRHEQARQAAADKLYVIHDKIAKQKTRIAQTEKEIAKFEKKNADIINNPVMLEAATGRQYASLLSKRKSLSSNLILLQRTEANQKSQINAKMVHDQAVTDYKARLERKAAGAAAWNAKSAEEKALYIAAAATVRKDLDKAAMKDLSERYHPSFLSNFGRRTGGGHGGGFGSGAGGSRNSMFAEIMVAGREGLAGRFARLNYTMSVLAQRSGMLGKALTWLATPFGAAITAVTGAGIIAFEYGQYANSVIRSARAAGFSTSGFQSYVHGAETFGEEDAAKSGLANLVQMIGSAQNGDLGATKSFMGRGINIAGLTNEQIYAEVRKRISSEGSASRRAEIGREFFGSSYPGMEKTILNDATPGGTYSPHELANLHEINPSGKSLWQHIKDFAGGALVVGGKLLSQKMDEPDVAIPLAILHKLSGSADLSESASLLAAQGPILEAKRKKFYGANYQKKTLKDMGFQGEQLQSQLDAATFSSNEDQASLEDRGKESLFDLAEKGRKFSGLIHRRNYSMTPRMRTALKIQDLEERATIAWEKGDDAGMKKFRDQADAMRKDPKNAWLEFADKTPTAKIQVAVEKSAVSLKAIQTAIDNALNIPPPP